VIVNDLGNTGAGGAKTATSTINVTLTAVNDLPVNTVPGTQSMLKGQTLTFNAANANLISIADVDIASNAMKVTLSVNSGILTLGATTGLTFVTGGNNTSSMTFTGTLTNVNAALNGLKYAPGGFSGTATITLTADDQGKAGKAPVGGNVPVVSSVTVNVAGVNLPPTVTFPSAPTITEDTPLTFSAANGNAIIVGDPDAGSNPVKVIIIPVNGALLLPGQSTPLALTTLVDTLANINAAINGMTFVPPANGNGSAGLQFFVDDQGNTGGAAQVISAYLPITVAAVNDAPTISAPAGTISINEDASKKFTAATSSAIVIADADGNTNVSVTLAVTGVTGTLKLSQTTGLSFTSGANNSASMTITGLISDINAALEGLVYKPGANLNGNATISVSVNDQGNIGIGGAQIASTSIALKVKAINDAPTVIAPTTANMTSGVAYNFPVGSISVADVDAGTLPIQVTLRSNQGFFSFGSMTGLSVIVDDDGVLTVSGTITSLNNALKTLSFTADTVGTDTLQIVVNDLGNVGTGGPLQASQTIAITVS
jgi:hypothetical protein